MYWLKNIWGWLKSIFTLISRGMKLEDRVSSIEKKLETLHAPPKDIKEGLDYNKDWNYYEDKATGECFCSVCLGNGKKISVALRSDKSGKGWYCQNCRATHWIDSLYLPRYGQSDYDPFK